MHKKDLLNNSSILGQITTFVFRKNLNNKMLDIQKIRADFPILEQKVNGKPLIYFDNGATSQKPKVVIDAITKYYEEINANIHRGVHTLSQLATDAYEVSREKVQKHIKFP